MSKLRNAFKQRSRGEVVTQTVAKVINIALFVIKKRFTDGGIEDVKEYQKYIMDKMIKAGTPKILAWIMTRPIPRLERWKNR